MALEEDIAAARNAVEHAQLTRAAHRRRSEKGSAVREQDLTLALERLKESMRPLRTYLGRTPYIEYDADELSYVRRLSEAIQRERRKLWKMQRRER